MPGCCCSPFECAANQQFNQKKVAQELRRYRQKGPGPTTRLLVDGIVQSASISGTVLDIGSGVGALTFTLLERGASSAVAVDASAAYVRVENHSSCRSG
jgi:predicted RNA methylase